jgi:hypothetical protein
MNFEDYEKAEDEAEFSVLCPWCGKSEIFADKAADIRVSCPCRFCSRYYKIDFITMRAVRIKAKPRKNYQVTNKTIK